MVRGQTRTASVVYARDEHGVSYAIEVIDAATWDKRFLVPPAADEADVRVVRLRAVAPSTAEVLPPWLHAASSVPVIHLTQTVDQCMPVAYAERVSADCGRKLKPSYPTSCRQGRGRLLVSAVPA